MIDILCRFIQRPRWACCQYIHRAACYSVYTVTHYHIYTLVWSCHQFGYTGLLSEHHRPQRPELWYKSLTRSYCPSNRRLERKTWLITTHSLSPPSGEVVLAEGECVFSVNCNHWLWIKTKQQCVKNRSVCMIKSKKSTLHCSRQKEEKMFYDAHWRCHSLRPNRHHCSSWLQLLILCSAAS